MRPTLRWLVWLIPVVGCGDSGQLRETQAQAKAAESALASLEHRRDGLRHGRDTLRVKVKDAQRGLTEARERSTRLEAMVAMAEAEADPVASSSLEAWRLEHSRDPQERDALAAQVIAGHAECDAPQGCQVPTPSLCDEGMVRPVRPEWTCSPRAHPQGLPGTALCTAQVELPASSTWASAGMHTRQVLTRVVMVRDAQVLAADWPPPEPELYAPVDDDARMRCEREQEALACRLDCLARNGARLDMCSVTTGDRPAREACMARCVSTRPPPPSPGRVEVTGRLHNEPAPGVYVIELDETFLDGDGRVTGVRTFTRVLTDPWLPEMLEGRDDIAADALTSLSLVAEAEDARSWAMKDRIQVPGVKLPDSGVPRGAGWMRVRGVDGEVLVVPGVGGRGLRGFAFSSARGSPPIRELPSAELCRQPAAFPESWKDAWTILCNAGGKP